MTIEEFIRHIERNSSVDEKTVRDFEKSTGITFPREYRDFLLRCNGGHVGGRLWYTGLDPFGNEREVGINTIGGFNYRHGNLAEWIPFFKQFLPDSLVWIMSDPFGNAICLGVKGKDTGKFFFWDHEYEPAEQKSPWDQVSLFALDFSTFLEGLELDDDE